MAAGRTTAWQILAQAALHKVCGSTQSMRVGNAWWCCAWLNGPVVGTQVGISGQLRDHVLVWVNPTCSFAKVLAKTKFGVTLEESPSCPRD